ncbi:MAG TPA: trypsin-like peptidase domain-containing protein, partial [Gemmataceae bacterium]|nr:trypsin-like peptidase domain-containing protein [Gemmataceae bacterium]
MKRILTYSVLAGLAVAGGALATLLSSRFISSAVAQQQATPLTSEVDRLGERFERVARKIAPTVVAVEAVKPPAATSNGKGKPIEESGSGVVIRAPGIRDALVLTNNHVVAHSNPQQITVSLADGRLLHPAQVWADPESDVALLRLEGAENAPAALLGDSDTTRVGQWVLAFGSPFGLNQTVTHGIISARERGQVSLGGTIRIKDFLQTDAAINPGSSGGPLVNLDGEVIGINTAIASHNGSNSGVAFSIPVNLVKRVTKQLLDRGTVSRGYLGMQLAQSFEPADALKLGLDRATGALVETVYHETPAAAAGLRPGDVVLQVDGTPIRNENHMINLISGLKVGQRVRLEVWRNRKTLALEAVVGDWTQG